MLDKEIITMDISEKEYNALIHCVENLNLRKELEKRLSSKDSISIATLEWLDKAISHRFLDTDKVSLSDIYGGISVKELVYMANIFSWYWYFEFINNYK